MNKPLSEWTAKEIVEECDRHVCCSSECRCYNSERKKCRLKQFPPPCWNLSEPPRWTEQDKEDARKIKAIFPDDYSLDVGRLNDGRLKLVIIQGLSFVLINDELLPSLKPGESATLDEIIGGGE